jgi:CrcB protein
MKETLLVGFGGFAGANARYWLGVLFAAIGLTPKFPLPTFLINISGSLIIGVFFGLFQRFNLPVEYRLFFATGILGGYTTFSSFSYETLSLWRDGEVGMALAYIGFSVILGLVAVWLGYTLARIGVES